MAGGPPLVSCRHVMTAPTHTVARARDDNSSSFHLLVRRPKQAWRRECADVESGSSNPHPVTNKWARPAGRYEELLVTCNSPSPSGAELDFWRACTRATTLTFSWRNVVRQIRTELTSRRRSLGRTQRLACGTVVAVG